MILEQDKEYNCAPVAFANYFEANNMDVETFFIEDLLLTDSSGTDDDNIEAMINLLGKRSYFDKRKKTMPRNWTSAFVSYIDDGGDDHIVYAENKGSYVRIYNSQLDNNRLDFTKDEFRAILKKSKFDQYFEDRS